MSRRDRGHEQQDSGVDREDREESEHQRVGESQRRHDRGQKCVQHADQRGGQQRAGEVLDVNAREQQAGE